MDVAKRKAYIKQQAALQKQNEGQTPKEMGSANPSTKGKQQKKADHLPKRPKVVLEPVVGLKAEAKKTVTKPSPEKGKGLMMGSAPTIEKVPVLLREDSKYALEQLLSIITTDDYEDLSNHTTEAMAETGLFCITQVTKPVYFLFPFRQLVRLLTLPSSGNVNDERVDGPLPQP